MSQAKRSRRMNSLFVNSSKLDSLSEPINKAIKPSQIYNDYSIPVKALSPDRGNSFIKQTRSPVMQSLDLSHSHCTCDCHRKLNDFSDSSVSTANSKRSKMLTPSPIKHSAREVLSRNSLNRSPLFPYGSQATSKQIKLGTMKKVKLFEGSRIYY
jgi:hypothetical protein